MSRCWKSTATSCGISGADTVHPTTLQLLDELGLRDRFAKLPHSELSEIAFPIDEHRRVVVGDLRRLKVPYPYIAMVPQWDLLNLLAEAGNQEKSYTLRMRTEVTELIREAGRVQGVRYRTGTGSAGEVRADLTVACDGRWSIVRRQPELRPKEFPVPFDSWWFRLPRFPGDDPAALMPHAAPGRFVIVVPREDFLQLGYGAKKGIDALLRARGIEWFRRDVTEVVPWLAIGSTR
jgi:2-polyprenyl-6-methoxyphenol hydroxylase-like FAD-dependent oxidoreductase